MLTLIRSLTLTLATLAALAAGLPSSSTADTPTGRPYGGCGEAWQAPQSDGAAWCRDRGWMVRARVVIGPHRWVHFTSLPHCTFEDGSGGPRPCTWNVGRPIDGNGIGRAYVVWSNGTDTTVRGMVR
jgi:hypothetical protein